MYEAEFKRWLAYFEALDARFDILKPFRDRKEAERKAKEAEWGHE